MPEELPLQVRGPVISKDLTLEEVIDLAFDYRGNVTISKMDGSEVIGYVFNRDQTVVAQFLEYLDEAGDGPYRLEYRDVSGIRFTGRDAASSMSLEARRTRKKRASSNPIVKAG